MRRIPLHRVPNVAPVLGLVISIALAITTWAIGTTTAVESVEISLLSAVLALQVEILVRGDQNQALARILCGPRWLADAIQPLGRHAEVIHEKYRTSAIEAEAQRKVEGLVSELDSLRLGRFRRDGDDAEHLLEAVSRARDSILAVTNFGTSQGRALWWESTVGRNYLAANLEAIARGVVVKRVVIYDNSQLSTAQQLARMQSERGVIMRGVLRESVRPEYRQSFAVVDEKLSWEAQMNADGATVANLFSVDPSDVLRSMEVHRSLWQIGSPIVEEGSGSGPA